MAPGDHTIAAIATTAHQRAANEVFAIAELLEAILNTGIISLSQLFALQRVSRHFQRTIKSSTRLRKRMYLEHEHKNFIRANWWHGDADNATGRIAINPLLLERPYGHPPFRHPLLDIIHPVYRSPILYPFYPPGTGLDEYHVLLREKRMLRHELRKAVKRFMDATTGHSWESTYLIDADEPVTLKWHGPCNNRYCGKERSVFCSKTRWSVVLPRGCTLGVMLSILRERLGSSEDMGWDDMADYHVWG